MNFHKQHLIPDFQQPKINPDFNIARYKLLGLKGKLVMGQSVLNYCTRPKSTTPRSIFNLNSFMSVGQPQLLLWIFLNPFLLKLLLHTFVSQAYGPTNSFKLGGVLGRGKS